VIGLHQVARYLLDREIIDPSSITARQFEITPLSGRNYNCLVRDRSRGIVLKQGIWLDENRKSFRTEQRFFRQIVPLLSREVQAQIPRLVLNDERDSVLAVEFVPNAVTMLEAFRRMPSEAEAIARRIGGFMGRFHAESAALPVRQWEDWLPAGAPWALGLHRPTPGHFRLISPGSYQCLKSLQRMTRLCAALERERQNWRSHCVVHADIKSDNLLIAVEPNGRTLRLVVLDWELAQLGDPAWDVAGFLHEFFISWLYSVPVTQLDAWPTGRPHPVHRAAAGAFIDAYAATAGIAQSNLLERAFVLCGARLVQFAVESAQHHQVEALHRCEAALKLAELAMCEPARARDLLERPEATPPVPAI
jgi:hypothetical protein